MLTFRVVRIIWKASMKIFMLIFGLCLCCFVAVGTESSEKKDLSEFPDLPGIGSFGGHSRAPQPPHYDKKTRTLRTESLVLFEKSEPGTTDRKFIIEQYQISEDGTQLFRHTLELYPGNRHFLFDKYVCRRLIKPFVFRSLPIDEECYNSREEEQWQFREDGSLIRIMKESYERGTDMKTGEITLEFDQDGHLSRESLTCLLEKSDPLKKLIQKELDKYFKKVKPLDPEWENPVFTKTIQKDGMILVRVHNRKLYMSSEPYLGGGAFNYLVNPQTNVVELKGRDR